MKIPPKKPDRIPFTQKGYDDMQEEQKKLLSQRPEAVEHLRKAREMGDLRENGYYKASRQRLSFLDARLKRLDRILKQAVIVEKSASDKVEIGSTVEFTDEANTFYTYMIVGGYESNPAQGTISYVSPLGKALMGHKQSDSVSVLTPRGTKTYVLHRVS